MAGEQHGFVELAREIDYAMYVVTAAADGERAGCLVGFTTQSSIHPARFLVCLSRLNHTYRVACRADVLAVHVVGADQTELAELFGGETGDEVDKLARCAWRPGPDGVPLIEAFPDWFAGRVLDRLDLGDHVGFLLEPIAGQAGRGPRPLTFHRARRIEPGHPA
jgi:flavin reductase (DIM6/NTAB) family NADH-FMN oxidoreductase RutF